MKFLIILTSLLAGRALAQTEIDAPITQNNPAGATFQANLQADKEVQGTITGVSNVNGTGCNFNVNFFSFPNSGEGPFLYHIHEFPVPADGNCTGTGAHLDPYNRTETPPCNPVQPETCQVGDLSGKHGTIDTTSITSYQRFYLELYVSSQQDSVSFFGNRSIVVHNAQKVRLNCGNFTAVGGASSSSSSSSAASSTAAALSSSASAAASSASAATTSTSGSASAVSATTKPTSSGVAALKGMGGGAVIAAIAAFAL